jgi:hypothetical protein
MQLHEGIPDPGSMSKADNRTGAGGSSAPRAGPPGDEAPRAVCRSDQLRPAAGLAAPTAVTGVPLLLLPSIWLFL